jgi:alpha-tubulin suppressor-like RCC1 family protein
VNKQGGLNAPAGNDFVKVTAGQVWHACALRSNGTAVCWGAGSTTAINPDTGDYGQSLAPVGTFQSVSAGYYHTCAIAPDGTPTCWGAGTTNTDCTIGIECGQAIPPPGEKFQEISCGFTNTCGIRLDGTLTCWGSNTGNRSTPPTNFP